MFQIPGTLRVSWRRERLLEKNGRREGLGVDEMLIVSTSGPESLMSSSSSNRSSMSAGSMSVPAPTFVIGQRMLRLLLHTTALLQKLNYMKLKLKCHRGFMACNFVSTIRNLVSIGLHPPSSWPRNQFFS